MKNFILLLSLFLLIACGKGKQEESYEAAGFPLSFDLTLDPSTGIPFAASTFDVNLFLDNFNSEDEIKIRKAAELLQRVIASKEFKDAVLSYTVEGENKFIDNDGLTNEQIYQVILAGSETLTPGANNAMDVKLKLYFERNNIIGYTYPDSQYIMMNRNYFDWYSPDLVSGNLMHEWLHKLGFKHSYEWNKYRRHSVPYAVGYIMEDLAAKFY